MWYAGRMRSKLKTHRLASDRVATALDSVRRAGHQQFGRCEKLRGGGKRRRSGVSYSLFVRQHKDDFIVVLHDVVIIMFLFRDYDGALQTRGQRCIDRGSGLVHGGGCRVAPAVPFKEVAGICPGVDDHLC